MAGEPKGEFVVTADLASVVDTLINTVLPAIVAALSAVFKNNPTALEQALLQIIQSGVSAYETHKGQPIDPTLIQPINPV